MKYIITESKLEKSIINYFYDIFPVDEINSTNATDDYGDDDENGVEFYIGDYEYGENTIFKWYDCEYFDPDSRARDICPTVYLEIRYERTLNAFFGNLWKEPFKKWFTENFDLPVKTIDN